MLGWAYGKRKDVPLTLKALNRAVRSRKPQRGLIFHTDRGIEYAAGAFKERLTELGITQSMNRPGKVTDNAFIESFLVRRNDGIAACGVPVPFKHTATSVAGGSRCCKHLARGGVPSVRQVRSNSTAYAVAADTWPQSLATGSYLHIVYPSPRTLRLKVHNNEVPQPFHASELLLPLPTGRWPAHLLARAGGVTIALTKFDPPVFKNLRIFLWSQSFNYRRCRRTVRLLVHSTQSETVQPGR